MQNKQLFLPLIFLILLNICCLNFLAGQEKNVSQNIPNVAIVYSDWAPLDATHSATYKYMYDGALGKVLGWKFKHYKNTEIHELIEHINDYDIILFTDHYNAKDPQKFEIYKKELLGFINSGGIMFMHEIQNSNWLRFIDSSFAFTTQSSGLNGTALAKWLDKNHPLLSLPNKIRVRCYWKELAWCAPEWRVLARDPKERPLLIVRNYGAGFIVGACRNIMIGDGRFLQNLWTYALSCRKKAALPLGKEKSLNRNYLIWNYEPWKDFCPSEYPVDQVELENLEISLAQNEHEPVVFMISNPSNAGTLNVRVMFSDLEKCGEPSFKVSADTYFTIRKTMHLWTQKGSFKADPLSLLDEAASITIPKGETRQIWVDVFSDKLPPGDYTSKIILKPLGGQSIRKFPLKIHVWNIKLPESAPIPVFTCDYELGYTKEPIRTKLFNELKSHRVNTFGLYLSEWVTRLGKNHYRFKKKIDFSRLNAIVALERDNLFIFCLAVDKWPVDSKAKFETPDGKNIVYGSKEWDKFFCRAIEQLVAYMKSRGLNYRDWYLWPVDETVDEKFIHVAKLIRNTDPQIKIFANPLAGDVDSARPYVDLWMSGIARYDDCIRKIGEPIWLKGVGSTFQKSRSPWDYRIMGCRAWDKGYSGICYWSCLTSWNIPYWGKNNPDRDEWDDFDTVYGDVGSFYPGSYGQPVPSLRWEAFREGIEDYCYLYILKQLIDKSAGDNPSEAERAKEAIENSIREILSNPDNYSVYSRCRRAIAEQILRLKGE